MNRRWTPTEAGRWALLRRRRGGWVGDWVWRVAVMLATASGWAIAGAPELAGSASCRECHPRFHELWSTSRHGLALQPFTPELSRGTWARQTNDLEIAATRYRIEWGEEVAGVWERGPTGHRLHPISHVMGGREVYYFLTPLERGRLQVLPLAYDVRRGEWFETASGAVEHLSGRGAAPGGWRDRAFTFNASCFTCHVSQLAKGYDPSTDSYRTTWSEPGISCEACHGPSSEHVRVCRQAAPGAVPADLRIRVTRRFTTGQRNALCASCHAKLTPLTAGFVPGDRYFDHFTLAVLDDPDFFPDGRDLGENYTYTSWRMNPCAAAGALDCLHCHTSSGRNRYPGARANEACLPCHAARVDDPAPHTHHPTNSAGSRCVSCHLPVTEFERMRRSDHSFRPPAPAATLAFGSPNACSLCHTNETTAWADDRARRWYGARYQDAALERGRLVEAGRRRDWSRMPDWAAYLANPRRDEVTAASILRLLRACPEPEKWPVVMRALHDVSPLVRAAAVDHLAGQTTPERLSALLGAARDEYRLVRVRAAAALASVPTDRIDSASRPAVTAAFAEYEALVTGHPDDPGALVALGDYWVDRGDPGRAVEAFEAALRIDAGHVGALANGALALHAGGRKLLAVDWLERARAMEPTNATVNLNLGLMLVELGRLEEAEERLEAAWAADPRLAEAAYNLGVLVATDRSRLAEAIDWCRRAAALRPEESGYPTVLAQYLARNGDRTEAMDVLRGVLQRDAACGQAYLMLGELCVQSGQAADAVALYRRGLREPGLPAAARKQLEARLAEDGQ